MNQSLIRICHACPHRQQICAGKCPCLIDGRDIIDHATKGDCPKGRYDNAPPEPVNDAEQAAIADAALKAIIEAKGRALWGMIHRCEDPTPAFIEKITGLLPCGKCKVHWLIMLQKTPPDFSSLDAYRRWTHARHNEVNVRIGKPLFGFSPASALYNW